jgi:SAM-dependent methyltransferase
MRTLSYSDEDFSRKSGIVKRWLSDLTPATVLDIGCNTGHFSAIAAATGARVVAIDADTAVVGSTWQRAQKEGLDILPLAVNIARPTPACGWRNAEYPSFLERATGNFEMVMMLAVVHHLIVTERIPLNEVFSIASALTSRYAILEYVSKEDPMFHRLLRGRDALHADFTQEMFERLCRQHFTVIEKQDLKGQLRCLYLLRKRED